MVYQHLNCVSLSQALQNAHRSKVLNVHRWACALKCFNVQIQSPEFQWTLKLSWQIKMPYLFNALKRLYRARGRSFPPMPYKK